MCMLTIEEAGFTAADFTQAAKREAMRRELAAQVQSYRALALLDQTQWVDALRGLNDGQVLAIIHAVMSGDHCETGRRLRDMLQPAVLEAATDRARDAFDARHDSSSDAVAVLYPQAATP
jgi:hypothetical protein